jgi:phosphoribosylformylglycinamidine cyclo-ligase
MTIDYRKAGVDIERGEAVAKVIAAFAKTTFASSVLRGLGHFGGFFRLPDTGPAKSVLVASTDGVGTKLLLANKLNRLSGIGEDLVNHCINDILCCGALPLFFLDYMAFGSLDVKKVEAIAEGLARACRTSGVSLIGGETAEMPDLYRESDFDLAGTIVGWVGENDIIDGSRVKAGDILLGLPSNGLHTNGYSLVRKIFAGQLETKELSQTDLVLGESAADALLKPHRSYLELVRPFLEQDFLHAMAHITGGGIIGNVSRVIPEGLHAEIDWNSWSRLPIFERIASEGKVAETEMRRVFNLGIGYILIVRPDSEETVLQQMLTQGEKAFSIGRVVA